ncbi:MAG: hypothetical protein A2W04_00495 [Betaproteobacteria bacterium RBG_16_64_9]|nr:MAG: hypothetical protein A2W04_00495 [Betaproteobacteria bacterium RBG_16_64_9]OGA75926.1 MAG: hypothetical protein A3G27_05340 [Betaproteobacteria bacterium RIFCSPLOWO2_12_FULL_66_14]
MVVVGLIKGRFEVCTRSDALSKARREELRALLMLKYKVEASCVDALGAAASSSRLQRLVRPRTIELR